MASITSLSNSSYSSSIYGSRNVLSGLASGMDTEQMIENAVSGIKLKIQNLQKKRTKVEWQQEAYRSIIDKAVDFNTKYTSYSSKTNLLSNSFFNNAVVTSANGTYQDKISASGKTSSDIKINAVKQMAAAATYTVSGLGGKKDMLGAISGGEAFDIAGNTSVSTVSGSLSFQYGGTNGTSFSIKFDELEDLNEVEVKNANGTVKQDATNAEKLAQAIQNKLGEITYNYTKNGFQESTTADKAIKVEVDSQGVIRFSDGLGNGNSVSISSVSGNIEKTLGVSKGTKRISVGKAEFTEDVPTAEYLAGKDLSVTLNGTTKKISLDNVLKNTNTQKTGGNDPSKSFQKALQRELDSAFGRDKDGNSKVQVGQGADGKLSLTPAGEGSTLSLSGSALPGLGFSSGDSNYVNTGKKLSDLVGDGIFKDSNKLMGVGERKLSANGKYYVDEAGNRVNENGVRLNSDGEELYSFSVNGANINVTKSTTLESLMNSINSNAEAGVKVSYSKLTNEFKFTATETGENSRIEFGGLAKELFGDTAAKDARYEKGKDAIMDVEVNGKRFENLTRSSNTFDIDGMTITAKGTFNVDGANQGKDGEEYEPITFTTTTDSDKIIEAIRSFVDDYNEMATEIKNAYSTMPATKSDKSRYEPLTAEQEEGYSESELAAYNEKAKQGILFGDSNLSSMYSKLLSAIAPGGSDGQTLREIGISTSYNNGMTTLSLDEDKLRTALESDPDKVRNAFTKTKEGGSSSDGLMQTMQNTLNNYVKTTGEPKGVLIARAGSVKAYTSLNNNSLKTQLDNIDSQIERWQDKMSDQIDRYTTQFTRLEQLIAEMNSQASAMSGLMGGSSGY